MNIKEELKEFESINALLPNYAYMSSSVLRELSGDKATVITLREKGEEFRSNLKNLGISVQNFVFIDGVCIASKGKKIKDPCLFYIDPNDSLPTIKTKIKRKASKGNYLVFDSPVQLLNYHDESKINSFLSSLIKDLKKSKTKVIICIPDTIEYKELIGNIEKITDKTLNFY